MGREVKENEEGLGPTVPQSDGTSPVTPVSDIWLLLRLPQLLIPWTGDQACNICVFWE